MNHFYRFWRGVIVTDGCWLWTSHVVDGYGSIRVHGRQMKVHRYSFAIHYGYLPANLKILHTCDIRNCVRPTHLFVGTDGDNARDRSAKGRSASVLTREIVDRLPVIKRRTGLTDSQLARIYGVHQTTITRALNGSRWRQHERES